MTKSWPNAYKPHLAPFYDFFRLFCAFFAIRPWFRRLSRFFFTTRTSISFDWFFFRIHLVQRRWNLRRVTKKGSINKIDVKKAKGRLVGFPRLCSSIEAPVGSRNDCPYTVRTTRSLLRTTRSYFGRFSHECLRKRRFLEANSKRNELTVWSTRTAPATLPRYYGKNRSCCTATVVQYKKDLS